MLQPVALQRAAQRLFLAAAPGDRKASWSLSRAVASFLWRSGVELTVVWFWCPDSHSRRVGSVARAFAWSVPLSHTLYKWDMGQGTSDLRATWDKKWDSVGHVGHA